MLSSVRSSPRLFRRLVGLQRRFPELLPHRSGLTPTTTTAARISRGYSKVAAEKKSKKKPKPTEPPLKQRPPLEQRFNELGVQQLSNHVHDQIFFGEAVPTFPRYIELAISHLTRHELFGKNTDENPAIGFDLPPLIGGTTKRLDEHFWKLGMDAAEPYLGFAKKFAGIDLPPRPEKWEQRSGWTKYENKTVSSVDAPEEEMMVFDVEVLYKISPFAVMACAASPTAWYAWISPWLLGECESDRHLIPIGDPQTERIIVGHNVGYDRARILEEYNLKQSKSSFLDTMSLHIASNGMCSRQRPTWLKYKKIQKLREEGSIELAEMLEPELEDELWVEQSSINSLLEVAKFHCEVNIDKGVRDQFGILDREGCRAMLDELLSYCASDVATTHLVYKKVLPNYLTICPHPVSFAALRHLSSVILPVNKSWKKYIDDAEEMYIRLSQGIREKLIILAEAARQLKNKPDFYENDYWLRQLDWSGQEIKMVTNKKTGETRAAPRKNRPGEPIWYKELFPKAISEEPHISVRTRIAPILLKLAWDNHPLVWSNKFGWTFRVPVTDAGRYNDTPIVKCDMSEEDNLALRDDLGGVFFKLPHKDGPQARCVSPLAKSYLKYFEEGVLKSEYPLARDALEMNAACSYWICARERIKGQMVVYESEVKKKEEDIKVQVAEAPIADARSIKDPGPEVGFILPQIIPMGTITRRAVERTWLTASNAKKNRVGSELKAMVKAPPGYVFVGSDVDSQELWIASLIGDAQFKIHGGNAIGFMTLEGTKAAGTDLHSKTAKILGISRNAAKIFNYGRIYGAGVKFASTLLRQFNPNLSESDTVKISENLYRETKGQKTARAQFNGGRAFWRGGTESFVFNMLENFANQEEPKTPVLGAGITEALRRKYLSKNGFLTSRINWAIQSSGVDYLHLLIISMDHLIRKFGLDARLAITVHDEIRYLVKEEDKYKVARALQVANVWTRAMFAQQMGIEDLPQSCAYFSAVDIDSVFRKEVDMDCITPSNPNAIPPGESIDITQLLQKQESVLDLKKPKEEVNFDQWVYTPRTPVMEELQKDQDISFLQAQSATDEELTVLIQSIKENQKSLVSSNSRKISFAGRVNSAPKSTKIPKDRTPEEKPITIKPQVHLRGMKIPKDRTREEKRITIKPKVQCDDLFDLALNHFLSDDGRKGQSITAKKPQTNRSNQLC